MKTAIDEITTSTKALAVDENCSSNSSSEHDNQSTSSNSEFINTGLHRWESIRSAWLTSCGKSSTPKHAKNIDVDEVIDLIVSNRWRQTLPPPPANSGKGGGQYSSTSSLDTARSATRRRDDACFERPVGLPMMVDVLVDLWEAEGLDIWVLCIGLTRNDNLIDGRDQKGQLLLLFSMVDERAATNINRMNCNYAIYGCGVCNQENDCIGSFSLVLM